MHYGPHNDEVSEVIDFIRNGEIFRPREGASPPGDYHVIHTLQGVDRYREPSIEWYMDLDDEDPVVWTDIKNKLGEGYFVDAPKLMGEEYNEFEDRMDALCRSFWPLLESQLHRALPKYEIEEIYGDLSMIVRARALYGRKPNFYNHLFLIYRSGGQPCGWIGKYPRGKMVVYYPPTSTHR